MGDIFEQTTRPDGGLFFTRNDLNDPRMGEVVGHKPDDYESADIVILGCPQDEGVRRNGGRVGTADAPDKIREQFYKLTTNGAGRKAFDLGNVVLGSSLEATHDTMIEVVTQILKDRKWLIALGGGNDISYADGVAMAEVFGVESWIGVSVDSHLDVRIVDERNSGTPYRELLDEGHLLPEQFYEVGYQSHLCSPVYFNYIRDLGVNRISLELLHSREEADMELKESIREKFIGHSESMNTFFGFDMDAVRSADAPGTSAPSPLGLKASEFIQLVEYAASLANTKIVEFTEMNPNYDIDGRTAKLVAIGMHRFCTGLV